MPHESRIEDRLAWFRQARFGIFLHWGPYAEIGRGEQVLIREMLDQADYEQRACRWNPQHFDARSWARRIAKAGAKYAVLTTRHHDGYCLWDSKLTDYTSVKQMPKRDFVAEFIEACRAENLRVGLYYSLADFRVPAYFEGPTIDPSGWQQFKDYVHGQVRELLTQYGPIDMVWFDGAWPRTAAEWGGAELIQTMRSIQPGILINNRLDSQADAHGPEQAGTSDLLGDFGTPEHHITPDPKRAWESCQVSTWRLWGFAHGERYRPADLLIDMLTEAASRGGNLLLNIAPDGAGNLPPPAQDQLQKIGEWMDVHSEAIYGSDGGDVTEFVTIGRQIRRGNSLYLVIRFWPASSTLRLFGLGSRVISAKLLSTGQSLNFSQTEDELLIHNLPIEPPTMIHPVIRIDCDSTPRSSDHPLARERLWSGNAARYADWARHRGTSINVAR